MNPEGRDGLIPIVGGDAIEGMEGIFVEAEEDGEIVPLPLRLPLRKPTSLST